MNQHPHRARGVRGFSAIELIVIIAVIVILAAYLFPVLSTARQGMRRQNCQGNLKQLARAMQAYVKDYNGHYPPLRGNGVPGSAGYGWAGAMQPQLKDRYLLQCPTETTSPTRATNGRDFTDYFVNARLDRLAAVRLRRPNSTLMHGDYTAGDATSNTDGGTAKGANAVLPAAATRHLAAGNYAFADGHVAWLRPLRIDGSGTPTEKSAATFGM